MLTITLTVLYLATLVVGVMAKTKLADKPWANRVFGVGWPLAVVLALAATCYLQAPTLAQRPAFVLYLLTPLIAGLLYRLRHWHKRHPGTISGMLAGTIRATMRTRRRGTRTKSTRQKRAEELPPPRPYLRAMLVPWAGMATTQDTTKWSIIHATVLYLGGLAALLPPPSVPFYIPLAVALLIAAVSFWRFRTVDRARQRHIRAMFGTASDKFGYDRAARNANLPDRDAYRTPETTIAVRWQSMVTPEIVTVRFPQTWEKTDLRKREKFAEDWEATFQDTTVKKFDWDTGAQTVTIHPAHYPESVPWGGRVAGDWHYFVVGVDIDTNEEIGFSVVKNAPHILVAGETGSGKTESMFVLVAQAAKKGWRISICDPKGIGWITWTQNYRYTDEWGFQTGSQRLEPGDARPGVIEHATELYGIFQVIKRASEELDRRKKVNARYKVTNSADLPNDVQAAEDMQPHLIVIDEALSLFATDKGNSEDIQERNAVRGEVLSTVVHLIVEARALMMHLMMGFQRPDTAYVDGAARDQMGIRLAMGHLGEQGKKMVLDKLEDIPALPLRKDGQPDEIVKGRGQARMGSGQPIHNFQSYWLGPDQVDLDEHLPMPEAAEALNNAPQHAADTSIDESDELFNPWVDSQGRPVQAPDAHFKPLESPAPGGATPTPAPPTPASPQPAPAPTAAAPAAPSAPAAPPANPFETPSDPWGTAKRPWPGVTEPEHIEPEPDAPAAEEPPALDPDEGQIVDTGQGRESYAAPVVWDEYTPMDTAESTLDAPSPLAAFLSDQSDHPDPDPEPEAPMDTPAPTPEREAPHGAFTAADFQGFDTPTATPQEPAGTAPAPAAFSAADFEDFAQETPASESTHPASDAFSAEDFDDLFKTPSAPPTSEQSGTKPTPESPKADEDAWW